MCVCVCGGGGGGQLNPPLDNVVGSKRLRSGRVKVTFHSRKFEFKVFNNVHLNYHNFDVLD